MQVKGYDRSFPPASSALVLHANSAPAPPIKDVRPSFRPADDGQNRRSTTPLVHHITQIDGGIVAFDCWFTMYGLLQVVVLIVYPGAIVVVDKPSVTSVRPFQIINFCPVFLHFFTRLSFCQKRRIRATYSSRLLFLNLE